MPGIHDLMAIGRRALLAQQVGLEVTGNNIANAQNPHYSRERVEMGPGPYLDRGTMFLGSGVEVQGIRRMRDRIYDGQYWQENASLGRWKAAQKYASLVEGVFTDFTSSGLSDKLDQFWNAWNELANHPEDPSMRRNIQLRAQQLASTFQNMDQGLREVKQQAHRELKASVDQVNQILQHIAELNKEISANSTANSPNNTLLDERDKLLDQLSEYVDVQINQNDNGTVTVIASNRVLVDQDRAFQFSIKTVNQNGEDSYVLTLYENQQEITLKKGKLKALIDLIQNQIPQTLDKLNEIARKLVLTVNEAHRKNYTLDGQTGINFFAPEGITAGNIHLSNEVLNDIKNIAVSANGQRGDGAGALTLSQLKDAKVLNDGASTINEAYQSLVGDVGEFSQRMATNLENQSGVVSMIDNQRQATMGVNLEEEFVNMIRYQHAFGAAAKLISTVDEMMQTILVMVR